LNMLFLIYGRLGGGLTSQFVSYSKIGPGQRCSFT